MPSKPPFTFKNSAGLCFEFLETGAVKSIEVPPIRISLKASTSFSRSGANLYLRKRTPGFASTPLLGAESGGRFGVVGNTFVVKGSWRDLDYTCMLQLSDRSLSWQWKVTVKNLSDQPVELDLIYVQDAGLKPINAGLINEYYVSQYLERRLLHHPTHGAVACCRQNMKESTGHPWFMIACKNGARAGSVDGMQFYGRTCRETGVPEGLLADTLAGEYAGESSIFALQEEPFRLAANGVHQAAFVGSYVPDHPSATSDEDLNRLPGLFLEFGEEVPVQQTKDLVPPVQNMFTAASFLPVDDLNEDELDQFFGKERRHSEHHDGQLLSFFSGSHQHVVLRRKEVLADRPHGHILQAKAGYVPDEGMVSTTCFAFGVFNSHLSQGNTNFNVLLSICTSPFNLSPETGQRIFVEIEGKRYLLGVPSAFEMGLNHCRWIYQHGPNCFQVRSWTSRTTPQVNLDFRVIRGKGVKLLVTHDFDPLNRWTVCPGTSAAEFLAKPGAGSMLAGKFPEAQFRILVNGKNTRWRAGGADALDSNQANVNARLFAFEVEETTAFGISILGETNVAAETIRFDDPDRQWLLDGQQAQSSWKELSLGLWLEGNQEDISAIREILPWYGMNALTHYLTPYGLEQFGGAAWGTRDVSQGPLDLLLALERYAEARQVLCILFSHQNPDGGWPQWWMFDRYVNIRADDSHGDIFYWCIIALSNYIDASGDFTILDEVLPYYQEKRASHAERTPLREHVDRLIGMVVRSFLPGTALVPFGGGDWNDSLQPVSKELAQRMVSSWTVEMNYQAFAQYRSVCERIGDSTKANELKALCERIKADFNRHLVKDGVVAGYGLVEADGAFRVLLHPSDATTGIHYSLLPMNRGIISGIFTPEQARRHLEIVETHLKGPDGARLMDRPLRYHGGIQKMFQRAESSTFFGREIGLMYVHEHIRYAEAQARMGRADAFVKALRQAIPVGYRNVVPCGDIRQSNCYYSSSDVAFRNRYEADQLYEEIQTGRIVLRGGWRVYSSGPGIFVGLVLSRLLGLRLLNGNIILDPVLPNSFDGLCVSLNLLGRAVTLRYAVKGANFSPKAISINGSATPFGCEENPYRRGGAVISVKEFVARLDRAENVVAVEL